MREEPTLEYKNGNHTHTDGSVGQVPYGTEKGEWFTCPDGKPSGKNAFPNGRVEHINHMAFKPATWVKIPFAEQYAVKYAVDDITQGTGDYQGYTDQESFMRLFLYLLPQIPESKNNCADAKRCQRKLSHAAAELNAESHAIIFGVVQYEPIAKQIDLLAPGHMCLYPYFDPLVGGQNKHDQQQKP